MMTVLDAFFLLSLGVIGTLIFGGTQYNIVRAVVNWFTVTCYAGGVILLALGAAVVEEYRYNTLLAESQATPDEVLKLRQQVADLSADNAYLNGELSSSSDEVTDLQTSLDDANSENSRLAEANNNCHADLMARLLQDRLGYDYYDHALIWAPLGWSQSDSCPAYFIPRTVMQDGRPCLKDDRCMLWCN